MNSNYVNMKARYSRDDVLSSTIRVLDGSGTNGTKRPEFHLKKAIDRFNGWVFVATNINAQACASVPLRLYSRASNGSKVKRFSGRKVSRATKRFIREAASSVVRQKAAEFGDDYEEVASEHPMLTMLRDANPWQNGFELSVLKWTFLQLTGNAYHHPVISQATGVPEELWILPSQWVDVIPGKPGSGELIVGYQYGSSAENKQRFAVDEVGHLKLPNPKSPYYGLGRVEAGWQIVEANRASHEMDEATYANHARPDYAVIVKNATSQESLDRLDVELRRQFQGPRNAGRFAKFGGDVQITPLAWPPKDLGERTGILEEVAAVFGVPITKLRAADPTYANADVGNTAWLRDTIATMLLYDEQFLNAWLLPLYGIEGDAFLAYDNPVPEDKTYDRDTRARYVEVGLVSRNEARSEIGLDPVEGGEELLVPAGVTPITMAGTSQVQPLDLGEEVEVDDTVDDQPEPQEPAAQQINTTQETVLNGAQIQAAVSIVSQVVAGTLPRDSGIQMLVNFFNLAPEVAESVMGSAGTKAPTTPNPSPAGKQDDAGVEPDANEGDEDSDEPEDQDDATKSIKASADDTPRDESERTIGKAKKEIGDAYKGYRDGIMDKLRSHPVDNLADAYNRLAVSEFTGVLNTTLQTLARPIVEDMVSRGARVGLRKVKQPPNRWNARDPNIAKWLDKYTVDLARSISTSAENLITDVLRKGVTDGLTVAEMQTRMESVQGWTDDGIANRAEMIARTESARAHVEGQIKSWEEVGGVVGKEWLAAPECCPLCHEAARMWNDANPTLREIPAGFSMGSTISVEDQSLTIAHHDVLGPPLHPNCRCDMMPILGGND